MTIKTKALIYIVYGDVVTSKEELYYIAIDHGDMHDFEDWLSYESGDSISDVFERLEDYIVAGKTAEEFVKYYKNEYQDYQKEQIAYLLNHDSDYHKKEIEVTVDLAAT